MDAREFSYWRFCAWMGPAFIVVFVVFWGLLGHNFPPFQPDVPAAAVAAFFRVHADGVRTGMVVAMTFAVCYCVWGLAIGKVMESIVGKDSILVELEKWGAGLTVVPILVSTSFWLTGAFRPEALSDVTLQMLYDMAWLLIDLGYSVTSVQLFAMGVAFLCDKRAVPLYPKWLAWYGIWVGFMFVAECLMPFFRSGAFARSGILNFWIEFLIWVGWIPVMTFYTLTAIGRIEQEHKG
jgi:hypothetical protein